VKLKKPFLLLEILIALMLVILCALPLIIQPFRLHQTEMKLFEEIEGERLADYTFSEIKETLLKNKIAWKDLPSSKNPSISYPLTPITFQIPGHSPKSVKRFFTLHYQKEKEGLQKEIYRIFNVDILFEPRLSHKPKRTKMGDYPFKLIVELHQ
jgi:hypothetical protein